MLQWGRGSTLWTSVKSRVLHFSSVGLSVSVPWQRGLALSFTPSFGGGKGCCGRFSASGSSFVPIPIVQWETSAEKWLIRPEASLSPIVIHIPPTQHGSKLPETKLFLRLLRLIFVRMCRVPSLLAASHWDGLLVRDDTGTWPSVPESRCSVARSVSCAVGRSAPGYAKRRLRIFFLLSLVLKLCFWAGRYFWGICQ